MAALAAIRSASGPDARERATLALLISLPAEELARWLKEDWFSFRAGYCATLFRTLAAGRLRAEAPELWAEWAVKRGPDGQSHASPTELIEWAAGDTAKLDQLFRRHPDTMLQLGVVHCIAETDAAAGLAGLQAMIPQLNSTPDHLYSDCEMLDLLAAKNPAGLQAALAGLPPDWQKDASCSLLAVRLATQFSRELAGLAQQQEGLAMLADCVARHPALAENLLASLKDIPADWLGELTDACAQGITPLNAAAWLATDLAGAGFSSSQCAALQAQAVSMVMAQNPSGAAKLVAGLGLPDEERRSLIARVVGSYPATGAAAMLAVLPADDRPKPADNSRVTHARPGPATPSEWVQMTAAGPRSNSGRDLSRPIPRWDAGDWQTAVTEFRNLPPDRKAVAAAAIVGKSSYDSSPAGFLLGGEALAWTLAHPPNAQAPAPPGPDPFAGRDPAGDAAVLAARWAKADPAAAAEWVVTLPAGSARADTITALASQWIQYDPPALRRWIASLPAADRPAAEAVLKKP